MSDDAIIRRRKLPHIDVDGKPYFITGCLEGSIPAVGLKRIYRFRQELDARPTPTNMPADQWKTTKNKLVFKLVDELLDGNCPVAHLKDYQVGKNRGQRVFAFRRSTLPPVCFRCDAQSPSLAFSSRRCLVGTTGGY